MLKKIISWFYISFVNLPCLFMDSEYDVQLNKFKYATNIKHNIYSFSKDDSKETFAFEIKDNANRSNV